MTIGDTGSASGQSMMSQLELKTTTVGNQTPQQCQVQPYNIGARTVIYKQSFYMYHSGLD